MSDSLLAALKVHKPAVIVAFEGDDDDKGQRISVPNVRNRWQRVQRTLNELAWSHVDLLDGQGGLKKRHERSPAEGGAATELEELPMNGAPARDVALLSMMLRAQEVALDRHVRHTEALLSSSIQLINLVSTKLGVTVDQYQDALWTVHSLNGKLMASQREQAAAPPTAGELEAAPPSRAERTIERLLPALVDAALDHGGDRRKRREERDAKRSAPSSAPTR